MTIIISDIFHSLHFITARLVPKIIIYLSCPMTMMVTVNPSVTEWQLPKVMSFHSLRAFSQLLVFLCLLGSRGMLSSGDNDFQDDLSVPSSKACLTLEDGTKSQCNSFYVDGLGDSD
jgi:uncharacterized membrane protein